MRYRPGFQYVSKDVDRHGNVRWYFRRPGHPKVRLPPHDSVDFPAAHAAAMGNTDPAANLRRRRRTASVVRKSDSYVYFLVVGDAVKIGFSNNPSARLAGLKTGIHQKYSTVLVCEGTQGQERALHVTLADLRLSGEWFKKHPRLARVMAQAAAYGLRGVEISEEGPDSPRDPSGVNPTSEQK